MTSCHSDFLEAKLLESIRSETEQSFNTSFEMVKHDSTENIIAGLVANVSYEWLLVKILWVDNVYRHKGIGKELMVQAEEEAKILGCHSAWLDTSNPAAKRFYTKLGYEVFGELKNSSSQIPPHHQRWFMKKSW